MVGFLTGFSKRTSANLRALQDKADENIKSYALQAAQDARETRKNRVKSTLDYSNMAQQLNSVYGLSDGQIQALLRGGLEAGKRYMDGFAIAKDNDKNVTQESYMNGIFTALHKDKVKPADQVRSIADQAKYFAQTQNPYAAEDIDTFASNIADSTQTLIGGVPMSYIKSGIESNLKAQMGGKLPSNNELKAQAPRFSITGLPQSLETSVKLAELGKTKTQTLNISKQTDQITSNIKVNDANIRKIDATISLIGEQKAKIVNDIVNDNERVWIQKQTLQLSRDQYDRQKDVSDRTWYETLKDNKKKRELIDAQIQNMKDTYGLQEKNSAMDILFKKEQIAQWKLTNEYQSPEELYGFILKQQSDLRQQLEYAGADEAPRLKAELAMWTDEENKVVLDLMHLHQIKNPDASGNFDYLSTYVSIADGYREDYALIKGVFSDNGIKRNITVGNEQVTWLDFTRKEKYAKEFKAYQEGEKAYVKEKGLNLLGGKVTTNAQKIAFFGSVKEDSASASTIDSTSPAVSMDEQIKKAQELGPDATISMFIEDKDWLGSNDNKKHLADMLAQAFPDTYGRDAENGLANLKETLANLPTKENNTTSSSGWSLTELGLEEGETETGDYISTNTVASWGVRGGRKNNIPVYQKGEDLFYKDGNKFVPLPNDAKQTSVSNTVDFNAAVYADTSYADTIFTTYNNTKGSLGDDKAKSDMIRKIQTNFPNLTKNQATQVANTIIGQ